MVDGRVVLCCIVSQVVGNQRPVVEKLCLRDLAPELVELHVHGLETLACNAVGYHSKHSRVDGLEWCGGLLVSYHLQGVAIWNRFTAIDEEGSQICLCGGGHDILDDL